MIFVGDDWAEDHHDIYLMDADGARLAARRLPEGLPSIGGFHELVAAHVEEPSQVAIGIETDRGLWVQALSAAGYRAQIRFWWAAPTPAEAAHLSLSKIRSTLKRAGRQRNLDARAQEIAAVLRTEQLAAPSAVTAAFAAITRAAVGIIIDLNRQITDLETELATHFEAHPDTDIYLSCQDLVSSSAPGCSVSSETTRTVTPPPSLAKTMPEHHRWLSHRARNAPYWPAASVTVANPCRRFRFRAQHGRYGGRRSQKSES